MVKDVENKFLEEFTLKFDSRKKGVVHMCFWWIESNIDLYVGIHNSIIEWNCSRIELHRKMAKKIKEQAEEFYNSVSDEDFDITSPLMVEIANNLDECKDDEQAKALYIYELLSPFHQYSKIMYPTSFIEFYQNEKEQYEKKLQTWEQASKDLISKSQIAHWQFLIENLQSDIEKTNYLAEKFKRYLDIPWEEGTIEFYWRTFVRLVPLYARSLDVLLLQRGINLMYYQQKWMIYLFEERNVFDIVNYFGGEKSAIKIINKAKPKFIDKINQQDKVEIPEELDTPEGREMLKALIEEGYCDKKYNWNSAKWLPNKDDVRALACLVVEANKHLNLKGNIYYKKGNENNKEETAIQWKAFEELFTYAGKVKGQYHLRNRYNDYMRASKNRTTFNPKEMSDIKAFFERLKNKKQIGEPQALRNS